MDALGAPNPLAVDLDDLDDIRAKLPLIKDRLREKQDALDAMTAAMRELQGSLDVARRERDHWAALLTGFRGMVPPPLEPEPDDASAEVAATREEPSRDRRKKSFGDPTRASSVEIVVDIIDTHGREMTTREVRQAAAPHDLADDTVSWALWKAASIGRIRRVKKGRYAPLAASQQSELAVSSNGTAPDETSSELAPDAGVQT